MAAPSEEQLIRDKFNLGALTVNQVKISKLWQTGKMFALEPKREVANRCHIFGIPVNRWHSGAIFVYISRITCAPCKTSSDWITGACYDFYFFSEYSKNHKGGI